METIDTVVIGAGHVGLAVSRCLTAAGRDHVVLDRGRLAESWRSSRWDSLRLLTPNWMTWLPGWRYQGADSEGFMTIAELTGYLDDYARSFDSPVQTWTGVTDVSAAADGYRVVTTQDDWFAGNVVMASGAHPYHFIDSTGLAGEVLTKPAIAPVSVSRQVNAMDVRAAGVSTVVWATGLRHEYPWLHVPVFDRHGDVRQHRGITPATGLYVIGQRFMHRRDSSFIDGARHDARTICEHVQATDRSRGVRSRLPVGV